MAEDKGTVHEQISLFEATFGPDYEQAPETREDLDIRIDRGFQRLREIEDEIGVNERIAARRIDQIREWEAGENATRRREAAWLESRMRQWVVEYEFPGDTKTRRLPHGEFSRRLSPETVEIIDPARALRWSREHGVKIKVVEAPMKSNIHAAIKEKGLAPDVTDGIVLHEGQERISLKVTGGGS